MVVGCRLLVIGCQLDYTILPTTLKPKSVNRSGIICGRFCNALTLFFYKIYFLMAVIRKLAKDLQSSCYKVSRKKTVLMTDLSLISYSFVIYGNNNRKHRSISSSIERHTVVVERNIFVWCDDGTNTL